MIEYESEMRYQGDPRTSIAGIPDGGPFQPNPKIRTPITPDPLRAPATPRQPSAPRRESSPPRTATPRPIRPGDSPGRP